MNQKEFEKLIKKDKYQVFVLASRISFPFNFAVHTWFVLNTKGKLDRWDVWDWKNKDKISWGHIHLNFLKSWIGVRKSRVGRREVNAPRFESFVVDIVEGSLARKMMDFIENNSNNYPYYDYFKYYPGPNSNTFVQWVLDKFPEANIKLPWNAFGKYYKKQRLKNTTLT